jgi:hypothetical protein
MISHYIKGTLPMADSFTGTVYSAVVNLKFYGAAEFIVYRGWGTVGTSLLTIEACSDASATEVQPVEFTYRRVSPGDTHSPPVTVTSLTTPAGGSDIFILKIRDSALGRLGWNHARLKSVEQAVSPVAGAILIRLEEPRYGRVEAMTAITMAEQEQQVKVPVPPGPPTPVPPVPPPTPAPRR